MTEDLPRRTVSVIGVPIDAIDWDTVLARIELWGRAHESRCVCVCSVHSVVTATRQPAFAHVLAAADMATPDGAPVAWMLRRLGVPGQRRINGPDLMIRYCELAMQTGTAIYLYGSTSETLTKLRKRLALEFPALRVAGAASPPFRTLTVQEDADHVREINASGAGVVFISLGCPKQELWMHAHRGKVNAVMVGVGAAFDFHAGILDRAPVWVREAGLEWLHRLSREPQRLWRRYLVTNTLFIVRAAAQLLERAR